MKEKDPMALKISYSIIGIVVLSIMTTILYGKEEEIDGLEKLAEAIEISGAVEIEAVLERIEPKVGEKEKQSDLTYSVELGVAAKVTDCLKGYVEFAHDEGERVDVDEAIIHYQAEDVFKPDLSCQSPWYASLGKMGVPFGYFENHFLADPTTQQLGELKETAIVFGIHNEWVNLATGGFNGDMDKTGADDHVDSFLGSLMFTLPEERIPSVALMGGLSYISNLADSDELTDFIKEELELNSIGKYINGMSAFLSISFNERYFIEAEYVGALRALKEDNEFKPEAWNFEFAVKPIDALELAVRYGGSSHSQSFAPKAQFGIGGVYEIFNNTFFALEYLHETFESGDEIETISSQFSIEF